MAATHFVEVYWQRNISEIKINSVSKNTKACVKILKQLFASGSVIIGEYSPRLRLGEYSPIITSPSRRIITSPSFMSIYSTCYILCIIIYFVRSWLVKTCRIIIGTWSCHVISAADVISVQSRLRWRSRQSSWLSPLRTWVRVNALPKVLGFLRVLRFPPTGKVDRISQLL
jgi:hypothetical protein